MFQKLWLEHQKTKKALNTQVPVEVSQCNFHSIPSKKPAEMRVIGELSAVNASRTGNLEKLTYY